MPRSGASATSSSMAVRAGNELVLPFVRVAPSGLCVNRALAQRL